MRLPLLDENPANIDEAESINMIHYAIDHGINYLDLGYPYDMKQHEHLTRVISRALGGGYRQKVKLTANLPLFFVNSADDCDRYLNKQLTWLQTDTVDFYLLGKLDRETWPRLKGMDILRWAERAMSDGRIGNIGFSFHDYYQTLREILNDYDSWALCQFQYSYMDVDHHPGTGGIKYAAEKGLAVVITEPLKLGRLIKKPPESVAEVWAGAKQQRTLLEWGLQCVWNHPEVSTVVSDMSSMEQVAENISLTDSAEPDKLDVWDQLLIGQVRDAYRKLRPIWCDACRGCMPCPLGIDVPRIFEIYNDAIIYDDVETARAIYHNEQHSIDNCVECSSCESLCGRRLPILEWLKKAYQLLAEDK
jgi:predicted aldo/keto reductase-like oxidoreductase